MSRSFLDQANALLAKLDKMSKEERLAWVEKKMETIDDSDHIINDLDKAGLLDMSEIHFAPKASYEVKNKSTKDCRKGER